MGAFETQKGKVSREMITHVKHIILILPGGEQFLEIRMQMLLAIWKHKRLLKFSQWFLGKFPFHHPR